MNRRNWIAVASAEHARRGRDHAGVGFMQVGHGKLAPLQRVAPGDRVAYYAPATVLRGSDKLQSFVSIGVVQKGDPYQVEMGDGFVAWRRDVGYAAAQETSILPLVDHLDFIEDPKRWGYKFRFGLFEISDHDIHLIAGAMNASIRALNL
ncbi:EVE domain-containing protein [Variovorax paradoxus]|nr:EVE domain-containing protein [Variovorax paradoxus]